MPIEIKELLIKVEMEETPSKKEAQFVNPSIDMEAIKADVVKKCTREVLEILKEREER